MSAAAAMRTVEAFVTLTQEVSRELFEQAVGRKVSDDELAYLMRAEPRRLLNVELEVRLAIDERYLTEVLEHEYLFDPHTGVKEGALQRFKMSSDELEARAKR